MANNKSSKTPVLIIGYNRVDFLVELLQDPTLFDRELFIHLDGPRDSQDRRQSECREFLNSLKNEHPLRNIEVKIQDRNLGCKNGVRSAIDWAFSRCDEVIIIEDDIRFNSQFLIFCDQLLSEHRYSNEIFAICGYSPVVVNEAHNSSGGYFKSRNLFIWGWATWKNRWDLLDFELTTLNRDSDIRSLGTLDSFRLNRHFSRFWRERIERVLNGFDTWDIQVLYSMWYLRKFSIMPLSPLTKNVGFDERATHTKTKPPINLHSKSEFCFTTSLGTETTSQVTDNYIDEIDLLIDKSLIKLYSQRGLRTEISNLVIRFKRRAFGLRSKIISQS